jgi:hypothetical protein
MTHQFSLFGFVPPSRKVPISAERIREAREMIAKGDMKGLADRLRSVREKLEDYEEKLR